jgi:RecA/RadA recombinase
MATLRRNFDISKHVKSATKSIENISTGFNDPKIWISSGSYLLNKLISNDFTKGIPLGKVSMFAGESGSGKSFICSGNIVRQAQEQGIFVVLIDSENALDESWLKSLGVNTAEDKLMRVSMSMIDDAAKFVYSFLDSYKADYADMPVSDRPKVLFVIDSLGALLTPTEINQFEAGDMKGDMGRKAKQLRAFVMNCVNRFGDLDIGLITTNHTYKSQDMFNPDDVVSGGNGFMFASSIVVAMRKGKLKEDEDGNKTTDVHGIRAMLQVNKTRYAKPFEKAEIKIPYESGMDPYSGLIDFFEKRGVFTKDGNSYIYTDKSGTVHKNMRKKITNELLDQIMLEWDEEQYGFKGTSHNPTTVDDE